MSIKGMKNLVLSSGKFSAELSRLKENSILEMEKIITSGISLHIDDVKKIEKVVLEDSIVWDDTILPFFVMTVIDYYLDNNFYQDLELFISKLRVSSISDLIELLESYISKSIDDKVIYPFLINRFQGLLTYKSLKEKSNSNYYVDMVSTSIWRVRKSLYFMDTLSNINEDSTFRAINSLISYTNYEIPFLLIGREDFSTELLINEYLLRINTFLSMLDDKTVKKTSNLAKIVFLNNLKFISDLIEHYGDKLGSSAYDVDLNILLHKYLRFIDLKNQNIEFLKLFSLEYSGLDLNKLNTNDNLFEDNISYSSLLKYDVDKSSIFSISSILSEYSLNLLIREYSKIFNKVFLYKNGDHIKNNILSVVGDHNAYLDRLFSEFVDKAKKVGLSDYTLFLKEIGIKFFGIPVNFSNLYVELKLGDKVFYKNEDNNLKLVINDKIDIDDNTLEIKYYVPKEVSLPVDKVHLKFDSNKFKARKILKILGKRLISVEYFVNSIKLKLDKFSNKLEAHVETLNHMNRVGKLLKIIIEDDEFKNERVKLEKLADSLFMDLDTFLLNLGYLHDIGKADNIHKLLESDTINIRTYLPLGVHYFISKFLGIDVNKFPESKINDDKSSIFEFDKLPDNVNELISTFYKELGTRDIVYLIFSDYYKKEFLNLVNVVRLNLKKNYKILHPSVKKEFIHALELKGLKLNEEEIDNFFVALFYVLKSFSELVYKSVTSPHITYGMHFFDFYKDFGYLSWVLFHHETYPKIKEIKHYHIDLFLKKWANIIGYDYSKYFSGVSENESLPLSGKDVYMLIISVVDQIDAILGKRNYQIDLDTDDNLFSSFFNKIFVDDVSRYLVSFVKKEGKLPLEKTYYNRIIPILDSKFKHNPYYSKISKVLLKKDNINKILSMYE